MSRVLSCTDCDRLVLAEEAGWRDCPDCGEETEHEPAHYAPSSGRKGIGKPTVRRVAELVLGGDHVKRARKHHTRIVEVEFDRDASPEDIGEVAAAFEGMNLTTRHPDDGRFKDGVNPYALRVARKHPLSAE